MTINLAMLSGMDDGGLKAAPAPSPNGGPRGSMSPPDPAVSVVRGGLPGMTGSMVTADPSNLRAHMGTVPGSEVQTMALPGLTKADRHPTSGRFIGRAAVAAQHPTAPGRGGSILDQQPSNSPQFPDQRTGPQVGVPMPVTATPPNPRHHTGGPESEQLKNPPGAMVSRLDLASVCSPDFAEQAGQRAPSADPMEHIRANPAAHLGQTPTSPSFPRPAADPDMIPTGPPDLLGQSMVRHFGGQRPAFGHQPASVTLGFKE
jgi:hypothetical protein